jgi:hypothetical protein
VCRGDRIRGVAIATGALQNVVRRSSEKRRQAIAVQLGLEADQDDDDTPTQRD